MQEINHETYVLFKKEILGNHIVGTYRKFFFGRHTFADNVVDVKYYVSYS